MGIEAIRKAAEQGDANAQCELGVCYDFGRGVEKNSRKAVSWYKKAAEQGCTGAKKALLKLREKRES